MHDINFFSVYKKKKTKSNGLKTFIIVLLGLFIIGNLLLFGLYYVSTRSLKASITALEATINAPETKVKIAAAERIKQEAALTAEYLNLLKSSSAKLDQIDYIDTALLNKVQSLTPATTYFSAAKYYENMLSLNCNSILVTDPMDMYHAFLNDSVFTSVTLSAINIDAGGNTTFSLTCQLAGGGNK